MDEDDKDLAIEKKTLLLLQQFHENVLSKTPGCRKLSRSAEVQNDALMHRGECKWLLFVSFLVEFLIALIHYLNVQNKAIHFI